MIINHGQDLTFLQGALHHGRHCHQIRRLMVMHLPRGSLAHHLLACLLQRHHLPLVQLVLRPPLWRLRVKPRIYRAAAFLAKCTMKHVMIVQEDGEFDFASDYDEETLALISAQQEDNEDIEKEIEVTGAEGC